MNTAIICFGKGNEYLRTRQIKQILKEENEKFAILCEDYDDLDRLIPVLKEHYKTKKIIFLHEDKNIDRFESAAHAEYNHLFEVEIGVDFSKDRLYELKQTNITQTGGTVERGNEGEAGQNASFLYVFPMNPLIADANKAFSNYTFDSNIQEILNDKNKVNANKLQNFSMENMIIANVSTLDCATTGYWGMSGTKICSLLANGHNKIKDDNYAFGRTFAGLRTAYPKLQMVIAPSGMATSMGVDKDILIANDTVFQFDQAIAAAAFKHGSTIMGNLNKDNIDQKAVEEWNSKENTHKLNFLVRCLSDIQWAKENPNDVTSAKGNDLLDKLLDKAGVYKDLEGVAGNLTGMGMGAAVDILQGATEVISDAMKNKEENKEEESKISSIISHANFKDFAACFDDPQAFIEGVKK